MHSQFAFDFIGQNFGYLAKRIDQMMQVSNIIEGERETKNYITFKAFFNRS